MPRNLLIEEFHVSLRVPRHLSVKEGAAICRTLRSRSFERRLKGALVGVLTKSPHLMAITVTISR